jgi:hypothetical protein
MRMFVGLDVPEKHTEVAIVDEARARVWVLELKHRMAFHSVLYGSSAQFFYE